MLRTFFIQILGGKQMEYKKTLLMPKTKFPMRGNLPNKEPLRQEKWDAMNLYEKDQIRTEGRPTFILHDGPPYANGDLHIGHALNKILKDFITRYKSMSGFHAPYVPGWDTHGLPIETALTKKKKINRKDLNIADFREMCAEYALGQLDNQREQFKSLGVRGDWDHPYITLTKDYEAAQIKVFGEMAKKGYIYKGLQPVYWSPSSESALAEAEIEYHDKRSPSIYVAFDVKEGNDLLKGDEKFVIWTTTPWTIPANLAIALHPEFDYVVVEVNDDKYIIDRKSTRLNSSHVAISYAFFCLKKKNDKLKHLIITTHINEFHQPPAEYLYIYLKLTCN